MPCLLYFNFSINSLRPLGLDGMENLMSTKAVVFNSLILLSLICFGISGSLSHIFNLGLVLFLTWNYFKSHNEFLIEPAAKKLFLLLCSVFFIFVVRGVFHSGPWASIEALSPMVSIPIIGLMILFTPNNGLSISAREVEKYAKISIAITFFVYIIFSQSLALKFGVTQNFLGRLEMFSGNPIPFSTVVFGVSIFCISNWRYSKIFEKIFAIACLLIGLWLAGVSSGTRGTLLVVVISIPILLCMMTRSLILGLLITFGTLGVYWFLHSSGVAVIESGYITRLSNGLNTLINKSGSDISIQLRTEMWSASLSTIRENYLYGYDISNRFTALSTNLPETFKNKFSHPHNDIFASTIGAGFIGGILSIFSLLSPIWAALLSNDNLKQRLFLGILVNLGILVTANVNTVFFNDITAAWLAFSTFLIWNLTFLEREKVA